MLIDTYIAGEIEVISIRELTPRSMSGLSSGTARIALGDPCIDLHLEC